MTPSVIMRSLEAFAKRIRIQRQKIGLALSEAADRAGLPAVRYEAYEAGLLPPSQDYHRRIVEALGLRPGLLVS